MLKKKILFLIHDLGGGGAEKVLINLVNHIDKSRFDVYLTALFGGGINEKFLAPTIHYNAVWQCRIPGNSHLMKLFSPRVLHRICVKGHFDVEVAYLEGPSARVISGCATESTKLLCWIHSTQTSMKQVSRAFRNAKESRICYNKFDRIVCVSKDIKTAFLKILPELYYKTQVFYNTIDTDKVLTLAKEEVNEIKFRHDEVNLVAVGKISHFKGFDRLANIVKRLRDDGLPVHLYALGDGPDRSSINDYLVENNMSDYYTFLGYQTNPYKYVAKCDLFVCASQAEGFSTATIEALIVGTPVCAVDVSGMKEILGESNEWGLIIPNNDEALFQAIRLLVSDPDLLRSYREKAKQRGSFFSVMNTVIEIEDLLESM